MEKTIIKLEIITCKECPFHKRGNAYSTDGWDRMEDWLCSKKNDTLIQEGVEWHEEDKIPVPKWCPIRVEL